VGIVDRLQALDDRFLPSSMRRTGPTTPPEWTPGVGPLVSAKRLRETFARGSVGVGLLATAVELVNASALAVIVATVVVAVPFGFLMSSFNRPLLETSLGLALPVRAVVSPIDRPPCSGVIGLGWWLSG